MEESFYIWTEIERPCRMLSESLCSIESVHAHVLTGPKSTCYSSRSSSLNMLLTSNCIMKERKAVIEVVPAGSSFDGRRRIAGITVKTHIFFCPSPSQTHTHTDTHIPSLSLSPPSVSHRWCVRARSILSVSSTDRKAGQEILWIGGES